jgi:tetratricopeptide (TPR) repeat protein
MTLCRTAILFSFLLLTAATLVAQAPVPEPSQESAVIERQVTRVRFENDGTSVRDITTSVRIQSEAGVQSFGQVIEGYSSDIETLEAEYVRVRKPNGDVIETPKQNAQDFAPEVLLAAPMYSDFRQRHITVVGLRPGDVLESHIISRTKTPLAAGEFWFEYRFPKGVAVNQARVEINVPKDRQITLKAPKKKYTTEDSGDRRTYTWVVENIRPERKSLSAALDEEESESDEDDDASPDIQLTTFGSWQQVGHWYAKLQGERVIVDDAIRSKADELTKGAVTPIEKTRRLYDYVARNFRYVSLSFGVGALQPHAAPEVLKGGYGDCKDKHTLLSALLRAAGIASYPVLIDSSRKVDRDVPSPAQFDHEITAVRLGDDLTWMDTTAEVAPFALLTYPLRNKEALLASEDANAGLKRTPATVPVKNTMAYSMDGKVSETGTLDALIELTATGDSGFSLRAALRRLSQADWERFAQAVSSPDGAAKISEIDVGPLEDTSKPLHMRYRIRQESYFRGPSADVSFLPFPAIGFPRLRARMKRGEPLDIGPAVELTQRVRLQFASNFSLRVPTEIVLAREYAEFRSADRVSNNLLEAERKLVLKVNELPASRRPDLESLRSVLFNTAAQTIGCTIRPASQAALAAVAPSGDQPEQLRKAAARALQQRDFQTASDLLKRAVEKEPGSKTSWADLGRAYAGLNDHGNAVSAFQKQVEINPYHKRAYKDLGEELQQQARYEEAIAAYRRQLENVPLDAGAHKSLGLLLLQLKRDKEALEQLEAAAAIPPGDAETRMALAQAYTRIGDAGKAKPLLAALVGSSSAYPTDFFAAALRDDSDPEQSMRDSRKLLDDIGEQFDSRAYDENQPEAFSAMHYVALAWARTGWAKTQKGEVLEGLRFLQSAWMLSQSPVVANRIARAYEKAGQTANAKHWFALAVAAGDDASREKLVKLDGAGAERAIQQARAEVTASQTVKLARMTGKSGSAEFNLVFDGSGKPERAQFESGDAGLRSALDALVNASYPVMFPDVSSVKVIRRASVSCGTSGCTTALKSIDAVQPAVRSIPVQALQKTDAGIQQK